VFILKVLKVICFDTLLQVLISKDLFCINIWCDYGGKKGPTKAKTPAEVLALWN
jgi:hypothetical protein